MKAILHIGTEKTASTTLQYFLKTNNNILKEHGYSCTTCLEKGNNNDAHLAVTAYNLTRRDGLTMQANITNNDDLLNFQKETLERLKAELKEISQPNIIFSSEHIQSRLTNIEEIKRLKSILKKLGFKEFCIIVYIRNPAITANSFYSTVIKSGRMTDSPSKPQNKYINNICNHKQTIERFMSVFGKDAIIPRIFEKSSFKNGSMLSDFTHILGIPWRDDFSIPTNKNNGISIDGLEILKRINKNVPSTINNKINPLRSNLVQYITKHYSNEKYIMPKTLWVEYDIEFKESNEWVKNAFFAEKDYLFKKNEILHESKSQIPNEKLDQIANLISDIWNEKQSEIVNFKKRSSNLKKRVSSLQNGSSNLQKIASKLNQAINRLRIR